MFLGLKPSPFAIEVFYLGCTLSSLLFNTVIQLLQDTLQNLISNLMDTIYLGHWLLSRPAEYFSYADDIEIFTNVLKDN